MSNFTAEFVDGELKVYEGDRLAILQPFKPTTTGEQMPWEDEAEALAYWESIKSNYGPPVDGTLTDPDHPSNQVVTESTSTQG